MVENCFILFHLSTGDNFTMYALIRHFQKIYKYIYIFCLERNIHTITQMYEKYNNIKLIIIDGNWLNIDLNKYTQNIKDYDVIRCGVHNKNWNDIGTIMFWRYFYKVVDLPYEIRYEYNDINRNNERELNLYNKLINKYGEKYIFIFDHKDENGTYRDCDRRGDVNIDVSNEIPIFHPNFNFYKHNHKFFNLWSKDLMSNNILDYGTIIENANEIIMNDSSFGCLCPYLNLSHIKKKIMYTNFDVKDYHNSFNDWEIINY